MGDARNDDLRVSFDSRLKLKFLGSQITSDAGLLAYRELDETLGLTEMAPAALEDSRLGSNKQHQLVPLLRQSIYSRLAGYEDVNDAERLAVDPAMRHVVGGNQTRLQLFALAYNLANFLRRLALPRDVKHWSLTTLREKLVKIGAEVTRHSRYITFQLAEVAVFRRLGVSEVVCRDPRPYCPVDDSSTKCRRAFWLAYGSRYEFVRRELMRQRGD